MIRKAKSRKSTKAKAATKAQPLTKPSALVRTAFPVLEDFFDYDWKNVPLRHAFGVYALCLYANLPDYREVATESLTEGGDDKDCDLCLIDSEAGDAFIVQATVSNDWNKTTASTNKAEDLLTALSWLLKQPYKSIPAGIHLAVLFTCIGGRVRNGCGSRQFRLKRLPHFLRLFMENFRSLFARGELSSKIVQLMAKFSHRRFPRSMFF